MIKPCPFCGNAKVEIVVIDGEDREGTPVAIRCDSCGARGPWIYVGKYFLDKTEILCGLTGWNERKP